VTLLGCASGNGFTVKYTRGGTNVTSQVAAGTYSTGVLSPGSEQDLILKIKAKSTVAAGQKKVCRLTATSAGDGTKNDTVKAKVKVK
jgi:hypothetical protein